jgi:hypothetical protein
VHLLPQQRLCFAQSQMQCLPMWLLPVLARCPGLNPSAGAQDAAEHLMLPQHLCSPVSRLHNFSMLLLLPSAQQAGLTLVAWLAVAARLMQWQPAETELQELPRQLLPVAAKHADLTSTGQQAEAQRWLQ